MTQMVVLQIVSYLSYASACSFACTPQAYRGGTNMRLGGAM